MAQPELVQRTARFSASEMRLIDRARKRFHHRSDAELIHAAVLHYINHRSSIKRPTLGAMLRERGGGADHDTKEPAETGQPSVDTGPAEEERP